MYVMDACECSSMLLHVMVHARMPMLSVGVFMCGFNTKAH